MALAGGFQGWLFKRTPLWERVLLVAAGVMLVYPSKLLDLVGFAIVAVVLASQYFRKAP